MNNKIFHKLTSWIHEEYALSDRSMSVYRVLFCLVTIFWIGIPNYHWIAGHPAIIYTPPTYSIGSLIHTFPDFIFLEGITMLLTISFGLLLFGRYTKQVSILITILLIIGNSFMYSFGKIDHDILFVLLPGLMAYSGWGNYYSLDAYYDNRLPSKPWLVTLVAFILGFSMWTAGVPKYLHGWLDPSSQAVYGYFIRKYYSNSELALLATFMVNNFNDYLWEVFDWLAVIFELGFLVAFFKAKIFRVFVFFALCFHLINGLMINVYFIVNTVVYLLFLPPSYFEKITFWFDRQGRKFISNRNLVFTILILLFAHLLNLYFPVSQEVMLRNAIFAYLLSAISDHGPLINALMVSGSAFLIGLWIISKYTYSKIRLIWTFL